MVPLTQHMILCKWNALVDLWSANSNSLLIFFFYFQGTSWMIPLTKHMVLCKWSALVAPWSGNSNPLLISIFFSNILELYAKGDSTRGISDTFFKKIKILTELLTELTVSL